MDAVESLLDAITETLPKDRPSLRYLKAQVAKAFRQPLIRNDQLLKRYRKDVQEGRRNASLQMERILRLNAIRSESGIAIVTVITEPYACPGRCVYCPTEARAPKSYLTNEPAILRALRNDYDPYRQVINRLEALTETGHSTDKVDLIIKGGTWSFYPDAYQRMFIQRCFEAANDFPKGKKECNQNNGSTKTSSLVDIQRQNETAACRLIGITIETRPDYVDEAEIKRLREFGITRVELGVQHLDDAVLELIVRDHSTAEIRQSTRLLRDAGFKVAHHLMPNLPGATPESDLESLKRLFSDASYRPDAIKIYPCVVIASAELHTWWKEGRYQPYDDQTLLELLITMKQHVPAYVRIERVIRDIPSTSIEAGSRITNLREAVQRSMRERGLRCRCIRCRQLREPSQAEFQLVRQDYSAGGGREVFLSFEDPKSDRLASLLRLRLPSYALEGKAHWLPELSHAAIIRELHTYGPHVPLAKREEGAAQHKGLGERLMRYAETIALEEFGVKRLAVIAGVGVRNYYRKLGYHLEGTYMVKTFS